MIPSPISHRLQDLTQVEKMLIARALPIMRVYIYIYIYIYIYQTLWEKRLLRSLY